MSLIVYSALWLVGSVLAFIFSGRLTGWYFAKFRIATTAKYSSVFAFQFEDGVRMVRAGAAWFAAKYAVGTWANIIAFSYRGRDVPAYDLANIDNLKTAYMLIAGGIWFYFFLKAAYYATYAPIGVTNSTAKPLTVFILGRRIGMAKPGKRIRNNRVLPKYDKYVIEAKTSDGTLTHTDEVVAEDLGEPNWRITVNLE